MPFPSRIDIEIRNYSSFFAYLSRQVRQWTTAVEGNIIGLFNVTMVEGIYVSKYMGVWMWSCEKQERLSNLCQSRCYDYEEVGICNLVAAPG